MDPYFSFLICDHGNIKNIYINGCPVGVVEDGNFAPKSFTNPQNGDKKAISFEGIRDPIPVESLAELKSRLIDIINKIEL